MDTNRAGESGGNKEQLFFNVLILSGLAKIAFAQYSNVLC
jgi:hypothetical protein